VYMQDLERMVRVATRMTGADYKKYAPILRPQLEEYLARTRDEGLGFWFIEFARILVKNRIKFPLFLTTFGRTNVILDGLARTYIPEQNTLDICGGELRRQAIKEMINNVTGGDWMRVAYAVSEKVKKSPELVTDLIDRYFEDPLQAVRDFRDAVRV